MPAADEHTRLRVLVADEREQPLQQAVDELRTLGHEVVARKVHADELAAAVRDERPDLAVVWVAQDTEHALELMQELSDAASVPLVAMLPEANPEFVRRAAGVGLLAVASPGAPAALQSAIELACRRFEDLKRLADVEGVLERRVIIERAKGVLMERHRLDEAAAYEMLRDHARRRRERVVDVAAVVLEALPLLGRPEE